MRCYEINLLLHNYRSKESKDIRQYFHQPKGAFQAIKDAMAWVHFQVKKIKKESPSYAIERVIVWAWEIAEPSPDGDIKTKRVEKVFNWSFEKGILDMAGYFSAKNKQRIVDNARFLNKYRHVRSEVVIEEIGRELITEDVTCFVIL